MALNYPGPYQLRLFYAVKARNHVLQLNFQTSLSVAANDPFTTIFPDNRNGSNATSLMAHLTTLHLAIDDFYNTTDADFYRAEVWQFTPGTFDAQFVTSQALALTGANAAATQDASQVIWTFRTQEGGIMKVSLMDTNQAQGASQFGPFTGAFLALQNALMGDTLPWLGRDTSYPISIVGYHPGQNEALFKKIYRI